MENFLANWIQKQIPTEISTTKKKSGILKQPEKALMLYNNHDSLLDGLDSKQRILSWKQKQHIKRYLYLYEENYLSTQDWIWVAESLVNVILKQKLKTCRCIAEFPINPLTNSRLSFFTLSIVLVSFLECQNISIDLGFFWRESEHSKFNVNERYPVYIYIFGTHCLPRAIKNEIINILFSPIHNAYACCLCVCNVYVHVQLFHWELNKNSSLL
jgi:hypothetical protein